MKTQLVLPEEAPPIRWGVIGGGKVARKFVDAVQRHTRSAVSAVGSRDADRARAFASATGVEGWAGGHAELVERDDVDAVYIASPHPFHREHALLAIAAGKHVLVEKPLAVTAEDAVEIARSARAASVFAMEAMWARFLPHRRVLQSLLDAGDLGQVVHVSANYAHFFPFDPAHRMFAPELAGGALLDMGVYPLSLAHAVLGAPEGVHAVAEFASTGVDEQVSAMLTYASGAQASVYTSTRGLGPKSAHVLGTHARVDLERPFAVPASLVMTTREGARWTFDLPVENGFQYQVAEFATGVDEGALQSGVHPLADSIAVLEVMDAIRRRIGLVFPLPGERENKE
ncbi:Gfo/Idh/MocA family protein [Microbacterium sp. KHB019]|uniref:Gfo/Idh/MocA family protein n=1 Tax=Microbacterium sp. KHB019 TaxID=3129770 RepID=UPI00307B03C5